MFPHYCLRSFDSFLHMIMRSKLETSRNGPAVQFTEHTMKEEKTTSHLLLMFAARRKSRFFHAASDLLLVFLLLLLLCLFWRVSVALRCTSMGATCEWVIIHVTPPLLLPSSPPLDEQAPAAQTARPPPPPCGGATGTETQCATPAAFTSNCTM